jgi:hypothetical protein
LTYLGLSVPICYYMLSLPYAFTWELGFGAKVWTGMGRGAV